MFVTSHQILKFFSEKRDSRFPVVEEIDRLFIPFFNQQILVQKDSLIGRIVVWGTRYQIQNQRKRALRTREIVIQAFEKYQEKSKEGDPKSSPLFLSLNLQIALNSLRKDNLQKIEIHPELRLLQLKQEEMIEAEKRSLLHTLSQLLVPYQEETSETALHFSRLFIETSDEIAILNLFKKYITKIPQETIKGYEAESVYLEEAFITTHLFQKTILETKIKEERLVKYAIKAEQTVRQLSQLKPGERWLYCGELFDTLFSLDDFYRLYKQSPEGLKFLLPQVFEKKFETHETLDSMMEEVFSDLWQNAGEPLASSLDEINPLKILNEVTSPLFKKAETFIRDTDKKIIHTIESAFLGSLQQEIESTTGGNEFLEKVCEVFKTTKMDPSARKKRLYPLFVDLFKKVLDQIKQQFSHFSSTLESTIPPPLQRAFDLHFARSLFWFECEREEDGTFTIKIYSSGQLKRIIDQTSQGEPILCWPYIVKKVPEGKLSQQFFDRLFFLLCEPHFCQFRTTQEMILEGLLTQLLDSQAIVEKRQAVHIRANPTPFELLASRLLLSHASFPEHDWRMRYEVFMRHLNSYWNKNENCLKITVKESDCFLKVIEQLISKRKEIQNRPELPSLEELTIIQKSIRESVERKENRDHAPPLLNKITKEMNDIYTTMKSTAPLERLQSFFQRLLSNLAIPQKQLQQLKIILDLFSNLLEIIKIALFLSYVKEASLFYFLTLTLRGVYNSPQLIPQRVRHSIEEIKLFINGITYSCFIGSFKWLAEKFIRSACNEEEQVQLYRKFSQLKAVAQLLLKEYFGKLEINWEVSQQQSLLETSIEIPVNHYPTLTSEKKQPMRSPFHSFNFKTQRSFTQKSVLIDQIEEMLSICEFNSLSISGTESADAIELITARTLELPPPKRNEEDLWDQLTWDESLKMIQNLVKLSFSIEFLIMMMQKGGPAFSWKRTLSDIPFFSHGTIILYTHLAIVDKLARKCPKSDLGKQPIFFHPLFYQRNHCYLDNPTFLQQLSHLEAYFDFKMMPEPDESVLDTIKQKTLFYPIFQEADSDIKLETDPKYSEILFLKKYSPILISKQEILKAHSIRVDERGRCYLKNVKVDSSVLLNILFYESFIPGSEVIPEGYNYLNIHCRLCQSFIYKSEPIFFQDVNSFLQLRKIDATKLNFEWSFLDRKWTYMSWSPIGVALSQTLSYDPKLFDIFRKKKNTLFSKIFETKEDCIRSQSEIYDHPVDFFFDCAQSLTQRQAILNQQFEMTHIHSLDNPIRMLGYLKNFLLNYRMFSKEIENKKFDLNDFLHLIRYCHLLIFSRNILKGQLKRNPELAEKFGLIMSDLIEKSECWLRKDIFFLLVDLSLTLQKYCQKYAPDHCHHFPDFRVKGKQWEKKVNPHTLLHERYVHIVAALAIGPPEEVDAKTQVKAALEIAQRFFLFPDGFSLNNYRISNTIESRWSHQLRCLYFQWLPIIRRILNDPHQQNRFFSGLLNHTTPTSTWKLISQDCYTNGSLIIDIQKGKIKKHEQDDNAIEMSKVTIAENFLVSHGYGSPSLQLNSNGDIEESKEGFIFRFEKNSYKVFRRLSDKLYRFTGNPTSSCSHWLEETENRVKEIHLYERDKLTAAYKIEYAEGERNKIVSVLRNCSEYIPLYDPMIAREYSRFCPANRMICWKLANEPYLKQIDFLPYQLSFHVVQIDHKPKAVIPDLLPGYYIAEEQAIDELIHYPSYLLLENHEGQRKVLIGTEHFNLSLCSPVLSQIGSLAPFLTSFILEHLSKINPEPLPYTHLFDSIKEAKKPSYMIFTLEQNGELSSESPESLAWLILMALMQWKEEHAERAALKLQSILKRGPVSPKELKQLIKILSLIPPHIQRISSIRRHLFAAIEENRTLYELKDIDESDWIHYPLICMLYLDLTDLLNITDPRYKLSPDEEWRLYELLSQSLFKMFILMPNMIQPLEFIQETEVWELLFTEVALSDRLKNRYHHLKTSLNHSSSITQHTLSLLWTAAKELTKPSATYKIFIDYISPILEPLKRFKPNQQTKGDWIKLFKLLYEYCHSIKNPISINAPAAYSPSKSLDIHPHWNSVDAFYEDFIYAYSIAKGKGSKQKALKLESSLKFYRGGWDAKSSCLIEILFSVLAHPIVFPNTPSIDNYPSWLETIHLRHHIIKIKEVVSNMALNLSQTAITTVSPHLLFYGFSSLTSLIPLIGTALNEGSRLSFKAYVIEKSLLIPQIFQQRLLASENAMQKITKETIGKLEDYFREIDPPINRILDKIYAKTFNEKSTSIEKIPSFPEDNRAFNDSLDDYYVRAGTEQLLVTLIHPDRLIDMYFEISKLASHLNATLEKELEVLLKIVNTRTEFLVRPLNLRDLIVFYLEGSLEKLSPVIYAKQGHLHLIEKSLLRYLIKKSRLQQLQRILEAFEVLSRFPSESEEYVCQMEQLINELKSRRSYIGMKLAPRVVKRMLLIELVTNKLIWPRQAGRIKERFKQENQLIEFIMSMGKTELFTPLENLVDADGSNILFNIWPSSLIHTNIRYLSNQSQQLFDQPVNHLQMQRYSTKKPLLAIQHLLKRIQSLGETISQTKEQMQSLELMFIEYLNQAFAKKNRKAFELAKEIGAILWQIRKKGKVIGDEAHQLFNEKEELLIASGRPKTLDINDFKTIIECFRQLAGDTSVLNLIHTNKLGDLTQQQREKIIFELAARLCQILPDCEHDPSKKADFIAYATNRSSRLAPWIALSPHFQRMAMMKGTLSVLLPMLLDRTVNVDFGPSLKNENEEFAHPYEANTCPREQSCIRNPHEAAAKTIMMFIYQGLTPKQIKKTLELIQTNAALESSKMNLKLDETPSGKRFFTFTQSIPLSKAYEYPVEIETILKNNLEAIFWYLEIQVHPQILFWETNFRSNCHNFDAMFASRDYKTGTPYNEGNHPIDISMTPEPGTIGEGLHILDKKCADNPIHILKQDNPQAILDELLQTFFQPGSRFTALIDGGAKLTGLDPYTIAKKMRDYVKIHRPDIITIDFFYRDHSGVDKLMSWPIDAVSPIPYDQCRTHLSKRLAYYDQFHGFGANLKQKLNGKAIALIGLRHYLYRLLQEAFRMRGLKDFRFFLSAEMKEQLDALNRNTTQSVEFALTQHVAEVLANSLNKEPANINLRDLLLFAEANQKEDLKMSYFLSFRQKAFNIPRRAVLDKLLDAIVNESQRRTLEMYERVKDLLTSRIETDPILLYHNVTKAISVQNEVVPDIKSAALNQARKSAIFTPSELTEINHKIESIPLYPMPETLMLPVNAKQKTDFELLQNLDLECEVNIEQSCEVEMEGEQEQENETEVEQEQTTCLQVQGTWSYSFKEDLWSETIDPYSLDWMEFSHPLEGPSFFSSPSLFGAKHKPVKPPLFLVIDLLKYSDERQFKAIEEAFSKKIWFTNNFLPTYTRFAKPVSIGAMKQRELFQILVHMNKKSGEILSVGSLSQAEMSWWQKHLANRRNSPSRDLAVFLYDMQISGIVAGDVISSKTLENNQEFAEIEIQLQYLNADVSFDPSRIPALSNWVKVNNRTALLNAFFIIHRERGKYDFDDSILAMTLRNE